jgi:hypothetical protein
VTLTITGIAISICVAGLFRHTFGHHPGQRVAGRGMVSLDNETTVQFATPDIPELELNGETPYVDVPVYPVERVSVLETRHDLPIYVDPQGTHELPVIDASYCRWHPTEPCTCEDDAWVHPLPVYTETAPNEVIDPDDFYVEDEDPTELQRRFDAGSKVQTDLDATGEWPAPYETPVVSREEYELFWEGPICLEQNDWVEELRTGGNGRAVRRLKALMDARGWIDRGKREKTPRSAHKRRKRRTLSEYIDEREKRRERAERTDRTTNQAGRHRRTENGDAVH